MPIAPPSPEPLPPYHLGREIPEMYSEIIHGVWYLWHKVWETALLLFVICSIPLGIGRKRYDGQSEDPDSLRSLDDIYDDYADS